MTQIGDATLVGNIKMRQINVLKIAYIDGG